MPRARWRMGDYQRYAWLLCRAYATRGWRRQLWLFLAWLMED